MAVQQNRKTASKRGMHRSHDALSNPPLALEQRAAVRRSGCQDQTGQFHAL